jgi:misacylated tRNA(Ala) deacylase
LHLKSLDCKLCSAHKPKHAVTELADQIKKSGYAMVHREDADMDYLALLGNLAKDQRLLEENDNAVIVLAGGEQTAGGPIIVLGANDETVKKAVQNFTPHLDGLKGGGKGRWQGKCKTWNGWENARDAVAAMYAA